MKKAEEVKVLKNAPVARDIFEMIFLSGHIAENAEAGQFAGVYLNSPDKLLPRPFGICQTNPLEGTVRIVYRVTGEGTFLLSGIKPDGPGGRFIKVIGPCGRGFSYNSEKSVIICGGGMGAPPLLKLAEEIKEKNPQVELSVFLGFQNKDQIILKDEFLNAGADVFISTDDGSAGIHGNVLSSREDANVNWHNADAVYACGPFAMLKAVSRFAEKNGIPAQVSVEERMGCGIGACVCCAVKTKRENGFWYEKVCENGPVFDSLEVAWND